MGGTSSQSQQSQSVSNPWAPAQPALTNLLTSIGGNNPTPSNAQTAAGQNLRTAAGNLPSFTGRATNATNAFLGGDPTGILGPAYAQYQKTVNPVASASLDPMSNPYTGPALDALRAQISDQVDAQFAGAGRDLSGMNTKALGLGISQGLAPILLGQYNTNVGNRVNAASGLLGAAGNTAGAETGNIGTGFGMAGSIPGLATQNAETQLAAANTNKMLPLTNASALESLLVPIAGLGGQTSGSANSTINPSFWQNFAMAGQGVNGIFNGIRGLFATPGGA